MQKTLATEPRDGRALAQAGPASPERPAHERERWSSKAAYKLVGLSGQGRGMAFLARTAAWGGAQRPGNEGGSRLREWKRVQSG